MLFRIVLFRLPIFGDFPALLLGGLWSVSGIDLGKILGIVPSHIYFSPVSLGSPLAFQL